MIFSHGAFNKRIHAYTAHEGDFSRISMYKDVASQVREKFVPVLSCRDIALSYYPDRRKYNYRTRLNLCDIAFENKKLHRIPYYQKNPIVIAEMIRRHPLQIGFVPEDLAKAPYIDLARYYGNYNLDYIPDHLKTRNMAIYSVRVNTSNFYCIPDSMLTPDFIIELVSYTRPVVDYIPNHLITPEVKKAIYG